MEPKDDSFLDTSSASSPTFTTPFRKPPEVDVSSLWDDAVSDKSETNVNSAESVKTPLKRSLSFDTCSPCKRTPLKSVQNCIDSPATIKQVKEIRDNSESTAQMIERLKAQYPVYRNCDDGSLRNQICRQLSTLHKRNSKQRKLFLASPLQPPKPLEERLIGSPETPRTHHDPESKMAARIIKETRKVVSENRTVKRAYNEAVEQNEILMNTNFALRVAAEDNYKLLQESSEMQKENENLSDRNQKLSQSNKKLHQEVADLSAKCQKLKAKSTKPHEKVRNLTKKLDRRDHTIEQLGIDKSQLDAIKCELEAKIEKLELEQSELKSKCDGLESSLSEEKRSKLCMRKKISELNIKSKEGKITREKLNEEVKSLKEDINHAHEINNKLFSGEIITFENGRYNPAIREVCMKLMNEHNVSMNKLPSVINTVLETLAGKTAKVPSSKGTLFNINTEAKLITQQQVATEITSHSNPTAATGNILHQDATSKHHKHYEGIQTTLTTGKNLSMGLRRVAGGDAETYQKVFEEVVSDLAASISGENEEEQKKIRAKIVTSFKATMGDQCAVNGPFNRFVEHLRSDLLPSLVNFETMTEEEKSNILEMGHFACRLHLLANMAPAADKGIMSFEQCSVEGSNPHAFSNEDYSGSARLIRTCAKALTARGSATAGVNEAFESFLQDLDKKNHIVTYSGHRFNILFHDAAAVYYHKNDIRAFTRLLKDPNKLLQSIIFDIKEDVYLAGVRALGIIDKLLTGPFQKEVSGEGSVLDLNDMLLKLTNALQIWSENGNAAIEAIESPLELEVKKDKLYDALFAPHSSEFDAMTALAIEVSAAEMLILVERQAETQLPGGKYHKPSQNLTNIAKNVPKNNNISERDMASLDNRLRQKPGATIQNIETNIMWQSNKASLWLDQLDEIEKADVMEKARKGAEKLRAKIKLRHETLKTQIREKHLKKQEEKERKEEKQINEKIKITRDIQNIGGLWTLENIDTHLENISRSGNTQKIQKEALILQLKFHKIVLGVKADRTLFQASAKGTPYSVEKLKENLVQVLGLETTNLPEENKSLVYRDIEEAQSELKSRKSNLYDALKAARKKIQNKQQKESLLPKFLHNPDHLVGKNVIHQCAEDGIVDWFVGKITGIVKPHKDPSKTKYSIQYEIEEFKNTWEFCLLKDLQKGDLIVIS